MTHRHIRGEEVTTFFVGQINSDTTEGRGGMVDYAVFENHYDAYNAIKRRSVQGEDGDVITRSYFRCTDCPELIKTDLTIYHGSGYLKKNMLGKGNYSQFVTDGWRRDYSPLSTDPEYAEYLRLKEKFEN